MLSKVAFDTSENQRKEGEQAEANGSQYKTKERVTRTGVHKPQRAFSGNCQRNLHSFSHHSLSTSLRPESPPAIFNHNRIRCFPRPDVTSTLPPGAC